MNLIDPAVYNYVLGVLASRISPESDLTWGVVASAVMVIVLVSYFLGK